VQRTTGSGCERQHRGDRENATGASGATRKRRLSEAESSEGDTLGKSDEDVKDERKADKTDVKLIAPVASLRKSSSSMSDGVDFDPSESPIELSVPDSDDSDSDTMCSEPQTSCLESARRLECGTPVSQLNRFPALIQQLQVYVWNHRRDFASSDKAQEFAEAASIAIRVGMKLQFLPPVRLALANLLVAVEKLEEVVDPLPSPLDKYVAHRAWTNGRRVLSDHVRTYAFV
jgi:hypothetical protein